MLFCLGESYLYAEIDDTFMLRLVSVPFSLLLLVLSLGLMTAGAAMLAQEAEGDGGNGGGGSLLGSITGSDGRANEGPDESAMVAGVSFIGFGVLGAIGAIALLIAGLSSRKVEAPESAAPGPSPAQQQQQQVVIVTDGDARVETRDA